MQNSLKTILLLLCISFTSYVRSQSIFTNPITGANPSTANPYTTGQTVNANISVSGIGRGTGILAQSGVDRYNASGWNSLTLDVNDYFEFIITPNSTCDIDYVSLVYSSQVSASGPTNFAVRSSVDNFGSNIGAPTSSGGTINLPAPTFRNVTNPITFRIYGWGATLSTGTFSINDFTFNGTVECGATHRITTGVVLGSPFIVSCPGSTAPGQVTYSSTGTFNIGNSFIAQLSDASGSFTNPVNIGTLASTLNAGIIDVEIPSNTHAGLNYLIRVISNNPAVIGTESFNFSVSQTGNCVDVQSVVGTPYTITCGNSTLTNNVNFTSVGTFIAGNVYTAQLSDETGSFTSPLNIGSLNSTANSGTISITLPNTLKNSSAYMIRVNASSPSTQGSNSSTFSITVQNCITTGALSSSSYNVTCPSTTASGSVAFTTVGTFNSGNVYTVQLSNASGSFASPTSIGTLSSTANSGNINFTIPATLSSGTNYKIRIVSSDPVTTGSESSAITINQLGNCITTGSITGAPFVIPCGGTDSGTLAFSSIGTFTAGNIYTAQLSNSSGSFASPTNVGTLNSTANSGTINLTIPNNVASGSSYILRVVSSNPSAIGSNSSNFSISFDNCVAINSINTAPFEVACPYTTANGTVNYSAIGSYNSGNNFTVQLSNSSGSFTSPTTIGTITSTASTGDIPITIPALTDQGNGYKIRILASNPSVTGLESSAFTINQTGDCIPPFITSVIYDGCNATGCLEGNSELVFGNTGSQTITLASNNMNLRYTTGSSNYDLVQNIVNNPTVTSVLNDSAKCSGLFVNGFGLTLGPNNRFLLVSNSLCPSAFDWKSLCNSGPIYVIYSETGTSGDTWWTQGNFGNTGTLKTFEFETTSSVGTKTISYDYDPPSSNTNGNYATYGKAGGNPATTGNLANCTITTVVLSTELLLFKAEKSNDDAYLIWKTASETDNDYFEIDHSEDGAIWTTITRVKGAGTVQTTRDYSAWHSEPVDGINYYKLKSIDFNGKMVEEGLISVSFLEDKPFAIYNYSLKSIVLTEPSDIELYSIDGKKLHQSSNQSVIPFTHSGIVLVRNINENKTQRLFVPD